MNTLKARGLVLSWARKNRGAAPLTAAYVARQVDWPEDEVVLALRSSPCFRCVHMQAETEFFARVADLTGASR